MSILNDITDLVAVAPTYIGYPPTGAALPYVVTRPLLLDTIDGVAIAGNAIKYDEQHSLYCAGASVEASWNLATMVMTQLQGARVGGTTLSVKIGYVGAQVESHYETQVTVQLSQGGAS